MSLVVSSDSSREPGGSNDDQYSHLRGLLLGAVRRRCPRWLADQSEDIVQEVLLRVMEAGQGEPGRRELAPEYLLRAAYNRLIDEIRRRRRFRELPLEPEGGEAVLPSDRPGPERSFGDRMIGRAVLDCIGRLQRPRRLAVTLYLRGHRAKESAKVLGWQVRRIQNLVFRGLRDLRRCLVEKGVEL